MASGRGEFWLASAFQSPTPAAKIMTPRARAARVNMPEMYARGIAFLGFFTSSALMATPSMARKNQIANGMAAKMPGIPPMNPSLVKFSTLNPGATTPMNTRSSMTARMVTTSSKLAAIFTPSRLIPTKTKYAMTATRMGDTAGNRKFT